MQMVKNVLLSHERTLARKLQEMFLTWYVETVLTKQRIMELYLNGIEYGPGIYGVTEASRVLFGKHPADLTPPEAVYIALILPSPVRRHAHYCRGAPSERMQAAVKRILGVMNQRGRLSDLEYEVWAQEPVQFDLRRRGSEGACFGAINRVQDGTYTQRALGGLLGADHDAFDALPPPEGDEEWEDPYDPSAIPDPEDPANADAPGRPAMDDPPGGESGEIAPVE
jgi:membrane peptidoglycan carboxypeptidase